MSGFIKKFENFFRRHEKSHNKKSIDSLGKPQGIILSHSSHHINDLVIIWNIDESTGSFIFINVHISRDDGLITGSSYLFSENPEVHFQLKNISDNWKGPNIIHGVRLSRSLYLLLSNLITRHNLLNIKVQHTNSRQLIWSIGLEDTSNKGFAPEPFYNIRWNYPTKITDIPKEDDTNYYEGPLDVDINEITSVFNPPRFTSGDANKVNGGETLLYHGVPAYLNKHDRSNVSSWHMIQILKWSYYRYTPLTDVNLKSHKIPYYSIIQKPFKNIKTKKNIEINWEIPPFSELVPDTTDTKPPASTAASQAKPASTTSQAKPASTTSQAKPASTATQPTVRRKTRAEMFAEATGANQTAPSSGKKSKRSGKKSKRNGGKSKVSGKKSKRSKRN